MKIEFKCNQINQKPIKYNSSPKFILFFIVVQQTVSVEEETWTETHSKHFDLPLFSTSTIHPHFPFYYFTRFFLPFYINSYLNFMYISPMKFYKSLFPSTLNKFRNKKPFWHFYECWFCLLLLVAWNAIAVDKQKRQKMAY